MNANKNEDGVKESGLTVSRNKGLIIALVAIAVIVLVGMYVRQKAATQPTTVVDESYSVQTDSPTAEIKPQIEQKPVDQDAKMIHLEADSASVQQQIILFEEKQKALQMRLGAPLMLVNNQTRDSEQSDQAQVSSPDANTQFMNQLANKRPETVEAVRMSSMNTIVAEGSLIHAVMESATNSDLPGYLRASVSQPVFSEDGSQELVPIGSRLIGQYKSGMLQGQSRIFIVWTRLITPVGVSVQLGSAGVDSLGMAGMQADEINRHFWGRFGNASLMSLIGAGAANVGVNGQEQNSAAMYREAVASSFAQSAEQSLQQDSRIAPTLKTWQGKPVMVFVAKDIDFQSVIKQNKVSVNVF